MNYGHKIAADLQHVFARRCCWLYSELEHLCESPIEAALGVSLITGFRCSAAGINENVLRVCRQNELSFSDPFGFFLMPQFIWNDYRIDWVLGIKALKKQPYIFIECDGHEFHERTKEQAQRDRERDREIIAAGIPILRFTGSEIYRRSSDCALEIMELAIKQIKNEKSNGHVSHPLSMQEGC